MATDLGEKKFFEKIGPEMGLPRHFISSKTLYVSSASLPQR